MPWPAEAVLNFNGTGDTAVVAGVAGQTVRVWQLFFTVDADTLVTFKRGSTVLTGPLTLKAGGAVVLDPVGDHRDPSRPWFTTGAGEAFVISQTGTAQISGRLYYSQGLP